MRNLKKFLALILAMMMTFSLMVTVNASSFEDDSDITDKYTEAVNVLTELEVIQGYEDDTFKPKSNITRGEVAAILYRIVTGDVAGDNLDLYRHETAFKDVYATDWYAPYINFCENNTLIEGVGNNMFKPNDNITGYEALTMILRAIGYDNRNEYRAVEWKTWASGYGSRLGLTTNIAAGSLGGAATREMVTEIMFKGLQVPMVNYTILNNYTPILLVDASKVNTDPTKLIYAKDVPNTLMYQTFKIVGKRTVLDFDAFGRPLVEWVKDDPSDTVDNGGKYIPNAQSDPDTIDAAIVGAGGTLKGASYDQVEDAEISLAMTPVKVYDNAIDECHMTKDINNDKSIYWGAITEYVNGEELDPRNSADGFIKLDELHTTTKWIGATGRTTEVYKLDSKVLITKATGAIAAADPGDGTVVSSNQWIFVYIDTFLGEVTSTTDAVKDTAGHTIIKATATVSVGNKIANMTGTSNDSKNDAAGNETKDKYPAALTVLNPDGKFKKGDLVLIQTSHGGETAFVNTDRSGSDGGNKVPDAVKVPEKAPLCPTDVPNTLAKFLPDADEVHGSILLDKETKTVKNVTIKATVGQQDAKMGIIASDGTTYYASNTFLAARQKLVGGGDKVNNTVLAKWYDVPNGDQTNDNADGKTPNIGIVNGMIGRTYDIVLDHHGYIIGMKEVLNISDGVGVITGIDSVRIGSGKYVSEVEAYMTDGSTKTFQLLGNEDGSGTKGGKALEELEDKDYNYFKSVSEVDKAWASGGMYEKPDKTATKTVVGLGSLVQFKSMTFDGKTYYKIVDWDQTKDSNQKVGKGMTATGSENANVTDSVVDFKTGLTGTLVNKPSEKRILDSKSVVFVAEYEYRYNTSGNNDGSNINKTYKVYEGFKKAPTIKGDTGVAVKDGDGGDATANNILYQQLGEVAGNDKYVLIYAADSASSYIIKDQDKIAVDDSYLVLSRGATYAEYSEYNVLKNGEKTTLQVSNANKSLNEFIESTMDKTVDSGSHMNQLLLVTGRNAKGYVTSVSTVTKAMATDSNIALNVNGRTDGEIIKAWKDKDAGTGYVNKVSHKNQVLAERDDVTGTEKVKYLTLDDNVKVQLVNRDQQTVTEISLDTAMIYANGSGSMTAKDMVFELNELGYVCNLYVIE